VSAPRRRNAATAGLLLGVVGAMLGLTAASVPLYRLFCQATGYGGTTQRAEAAPTEEVTDRLVTVRFNADTAPDLGWEFRPLQASVQVHPGATAVIVYRAVNRTKQAETATATFNVTPDKAGIYFDKLQCFCFTRQHLAAGESADLPVKFFVDPDIVKDAADNDVDTITLSYTMFRAADQSVPGPSASAEPVSPNSLR